MPEQYITGAQILQLAGSPSDWIVNQLDPDHWLLAGIALFVGLNGFAILQRFNVHLNRAPDAF